MVRLLAQDWFNPCEWVDKQSRRVLQRSSVGQAISYARAQPEDLQTSTCDGDLSIDNTTKADERRCVRPRSQD